MWCELTAHSPVIGVSIFPSFSSPDLTCLSHGRVEGLSYWLGLGFSVTGSYRALLYLHTPGFAWVLVIISKFLPGHLFPK